MDKSHKKLISIDFDGVIHDYQNGWQDGDINGKPMDRAFENILKLKDNGFDIAIFSTRNSVEGQILKMKEWFLDNKMQIEDVADLLFPVSKPKALVYIDDRALRFTNWQDIRKYFF